MKKHLVMKASVMLVVMFFHSFVFVPRVHATTWEGLAGRLAFRAVAPSVIAAMGSGTALVIGAVVAGGIGYLVYKSGAVSALKSWLNAQLTSYNIPPVGSGGTVVVHGTNGATRTAVNFTYAGPPPDSDWYHLYNGSSYCGDCRNSQVGSFLEGVSGGIQPAAAPTSPTDYAGAMATTQPNFGNNDVFGSPGVAAAIAGGAAIVSAATMSDSDADKFIAGIGGSSSAAISDTGSQAGSPSITDNTVTAGDSAQLSILQQIMQFVSNLVGIKTSIDNVASASIAQSVKLDNIVSLTNVQNAKIDNLVSVGIQQKASMDNVAQMVNTQTQAIENIETKVEHLDNTITSSVATSSTVASRIDALKTAASTKFPFSLASSLSVSAVSGTSTYEFAALPLTSSISIPIAPMAGPLHDLFVWIRQLLVWFFWAGTLLAILRKGMAM